MSDYSSTYPTQRPTFAFDAKAGKLDSRLSYSRSSGGTYMSSEKSLNSENLISYSNLNTSLWSRTAAGISSSAGTAPNGGDSSTLTEDSANSQHRAYAATTVASGENLTIVAYLKANGRSIVRLEQTGTYTTSNVVEFELSGSGTATTKLGSPTNVSIAQVGSTGWYKVSYSSTTDSAGTHYTQVRLCSAADTTVYTGDGTSGVLVFGVNLSATGQLITNETSGSIHRAFAPLLKTAAADEPRFEYASDGQSEGLLIEAQSSNLLTYSEDFSNAAWSKTRLNIDSSVAVAPDGTLTASALRVDGTAANSHRMRFTYATGGATPQTFSIFAKAGSKSWLTLSFGGTGVFAGSSAYFNLANGTIGTVAADADAKIIDCGNGWYRCSVTVTALTSGSGRVTVYVSDGDNDLVFDGNSYDHILCWGAMIEANISAPSSYIKSNSGSSTSRAADSCSVDLNGILASGQDVTLYAEGDWGDYTVKPYNRFLAALSENRDPNWIALYNAGSSGASYIKYENNLEAVQTGVAANGNQKAAVSVAMNSINHAAAGVASAEDTSATVPPYTQLNIGNNRDAGTISLNGHCTRVALYGQALSSSELAALTS